jgi:hypothetical protein
MAPVEAVAQLPTERRAVWNNTLVMDQRLQTEGKLSTKGENYFEGRRIIHRNSPINGGVYLGAGQREAIVVDSKSSHAYKNSMLMRE